MDFSDVAHWENNKLDRRESSRMGWSDISISLHGSAVESLREHFVARWNFIYNEKYDVRSDRRYTPLSMFSSQAAFPQLPETIQSANTALQAAHPHFLKMEERVEKHLQHAQDQYQGAIGSAPPPAGGISCQIVRSCSKWSHGVATEHSIVNAYISIIHDSQHFIYIENQFFITATSAAQSPVKNRIGAAIVERIVRAAKAGEKYKVIVIMPAVPAFAGDLKDDSSLGTRAIMEYQYNSINRGGHSIMESIADAGFNPTDYIRFYNLRNYDRINAGATMREIERESGVDYELARREHDNKMDPAGMASRTRDIDHPETSSGANYQRYQAAARNILARKGPGHKRWDSVSECYMLNGPDIREIPWEDGDISEIDAFVSEELYIHSKVGNHPI